MTPSLWLTALGRRPSAFRPLAAVAASAVLVAGFVGLALGLASATQHAQAIATRRAAGAEAEGAAVRYLALGGRTLVRVVHSADSDAGPPRGQVRTTASGITLARTDPAVGDLFAGRSLVLDPRPVVTLPGEVVFEERASRRVDLTAAPDPNDEALAALRSTSMLMLLALVVPALSMFSATVRFVRTRREERDLTLRYLGVDDRIVRRADLVGAVVAAGAGGLVGVAFAWAIGKGVGAIRLGTLGVELGAGQDPGLSLLAPVVFATALAGGCSLLTGRSTSTVPPRRRRVPWPLLSAVAVSASLLAFRPLGAHRGPQPTAGWSVLVGLALSAVVVGGPGMVTLVVRGAGRSLARWRSSLLAGSRMSRRPALLRGVAGAIAALAGFTFLAAGSPGPADAPTAPPSFRYVIHLIDTQEAGADATRAVADLARRHHGSAVRVDYSFVALDQGRALTVASASCASISHLTDGVRGCRPGRAWSTSPAVPTGWHRLDPLTRPTTAPLSGRFSIGAAERGFLASTARPDLIVSGGQVGTTRDLFIFGGDSGFLRAALDLLDTLPADVGSISTAAEVAAQSPGRSDPSEALLRLAGTAMLALVAGGIALGTGSVVRTLRRETTVEWVLGRAFGATAVDLAILVLVPALLASVPAVVLGAVGGALFVGRAPAAASVGTLAVGSIGVSLAASTVAVVGSVLAAGRSRDIAALRTTG